MSICTRRQFLEGLGCSAAGLAGAAFLSCSRPPAPEPAAGPLNFVVIVADDLGWTDLACYGSRFYETPSIDRLAEQGMRFTSAYAACPVCSPTRASILTGQYPARVNITNFIPGAHYLPYSPVLPPEDLDELPLEEITLAEALAAAGYRSAAIGKWHLGGEGFLPQDQGFSLGYAVRRQPGASRRFFHPGWLGRGSTPGTEGEFLPDHLTDRALEFVEAHQNGRFFLYLPFHVPHIPIEAKPEYIEKFRPKVAAGPVPGKDQHNPTYAAMIYSLDENVGRLMDKLDELGLADRTVVLFTSDNGGLTAPEFRNEPVTSNLPLREGKGHLYEGGIRVPLIVRWPGVVRPASISDEPVISNDFFPTILALAGADYDYAAHPIDGVSLASILREGGSLRPRELYWHYPHHSNQLGRPGGAVRQGDFKLIEFYDDDAVELYNLKDDLDEANDLAQAMPEKTAQLKKLLHDWRQAVGAQTMRPNPDYDPKRADLRVRPGRPANPAR